MAVRLRTRVPRRWLGNGFGYERASYDIMDGDEVIATVEPSGSVGWYVKTRDGVRFFWVLAEVRAWGNGEQRRRRRAEMAR